ncbi:hypothetical protein KY284_013295 [Solanum tuberosum]|nr:hypothetical protein KY284_013295 [Solanum tuberosum]
MPRGAVEKAMRNDGASRHGGDGLEELLCLDAGVGRDSGDEVALRRGWRENWGTTVPRGRGGGGTRATMVPRGGSEGVGGRWCLEDGGRGASCTTVP